MSYEKNIIRDLIALIGDDPDREGLIETPRRVLQAYNEWFVGYGMVPSEILKEVDSSNGMDEMVIEHNIPFNSYCEHHLAPIRGHAHVGYIPNGRICGISKLARLVECFGRRLQVQERCTVQIADAMVEYLKPIGVGVLIRASHGCMETRGVKMHGTLTTTSAMRGALLEKQSQARMEFLQLCEMAERAKE
jgi:GTP cyclohydrolase I